MSLMYIVITYIATRSHTHKQSQISLSAGMTGATKDEYRAEIHMENVNQYGDRQAFVLRHLLCS